MEKKNKVTNKRRKKATGNKRAYLTAVLCLCGIVAIGGIAFYMHVCRAKYEGESTRIYIPKGSTADAIKDTLTHNLGEDFGKRVYDIWSWRGGKPERAAGSYVVKEGDVAMNVSRKLKVHAEDPVRVTFNNVRTMDQLATKISANMGFTAQEFLDACDAELPTLGFVKGTYPAAFLPDTYEFYWSADPEYVVRRLVKTRTKFWTPERLSIAKGLGLTPEQVATVASIVEEETVKTDERPKVARLYLNRLARGMKLQADPTVKYAVGDFGLRRITNKHLSCESPYNTYLHAGLPPGPIRVVEGKTLDAVLYAPSHPYLYMCAKEDFSGYHNFAVSDREHLENARRYHAALNRRGIR